jgi:hypothetical protein
MRGRKGVMRFQSIPHMETGMNDGNDFAGVEKVAGFVQLNEGELRSHVTEAPLGTRFSRSTVSELKPEDLRPDRCGA